jgi:hypothetical protein
MVFHTCLLATLFLATTVASDSGQYRANEARVNAIAANPQAIGPKEIEFLSAHSYFHQAIKALSEASTPEARAALQTAAFAGNQYAARLFVRGLTNKLEGLKLLDSKSPEVQLIALRGMLGPTVSARVVLDRRAWEVVTNLLMSEKLEWRSQATWVVFQSDGPEVTAEEKAKALVASMSTTLQTPEAARKIAPVNEQYHEEWPSGHYVLSKQAKCLGTLKGVPLPYLRRASTEASGLVAEFLLVARGFAGDAEAKPELERLLQTSRPRVRLSALEAYSSLAGKDDVPFLQSLLTDPFCRTNYFEQPYYPVRARAEYLIKRLGENTGN